VFPYFALSSRALRLTTLGALGLLVGCADAPPPAAAPPRVEVVSVAPRTLAESFDFTGEVVAWRRVEVRAAIEGIIEERTFQEGAEVRPAQILYRIDRTVWEAALRDAEARRQLAERTVERLRPLLANNAVAKQDVDNAEAELLRARAEEDEARKHLDDTIVRAEIGGRIGKTRLDRGGRITGSDDLLTTIDQLDPIYVSFHPSRQQVAAWLSRPDGPSLIKPGSALRIDAILPDGSVYPVAGALDYIDPVLGAGTGTQEFRARLANRDRVLVPGQFVRARVSGFVRDSALTVPQRAVQQSLGRQFVYLVGPGDTVAVRNVVPGSWTGDQWVIEEGLTPGDRVVVSGVQKIRAGMVVSPVVIPADSMDASGE